MCLFLRILNRIVQENHITDLPPGAIPATMQCALGLRRAHRCTRANCRTLAAAAKFFRETPGERPMKRIEIGAYGAPEDVARCRRGPGVGDPGRERSSSTCSPFRSTRPICRSAAAVIGCARISRRPPARNASAGWARSAPASADLKPGDLVINLQRENWAQARRVREDDAIPIPSGQT